MSNHRLETHRVRDWLFATPRRVTAAVAATVALLVGVLGYVGISSATTPALGNITCVGPGVDENGTAHLECNIPLPSASTVTVTTPVPTTVTSTVVSPSPTTVTSTTTVTGPPSTTPPPTTTPAPSATTPPVTTTTTSSPPAAPGTTLTNCFDRLDQCGYPSKNTTGVKGPVTAYTGPSTITKDGTVIDGKKTSCLEVRAKNVVIKNSLIVNGGGCFWMVDVLGSLTIEDTTVDCVDYRTTGIAEKNFVARRVQVIRCENGFDTSWGNITIEDSYVGDVREVDGGHGDGIQLSGGPDVMRDVVLRHNTIDMLNPVTSSIEWDRMPSANVLVERNIFSVGAYTVYCPDPRGSVIFRDNRFGTGVHGPAYGFQEGCKVSGITWTGNYRDDNLKAV